MTRGQKRSLVRRSHGWLGLAVSLLVLVVAGSGIVLQHPDWTGAPANDPLSLAVDPTDPQRMLRGTHWGVEVSEDGGLEWREVNMLAPPTDVRRILFVPRAPGDGIVYAMGTGSLVVSSDGGRVWRAVAGPENERLSGARFLDLTVSVRGELDLLTTIGQFRLANGGPWASVGEIAAPRRDWRRWMHDLHTGQLWGTAGRRFAEAGAWGLLVLTATGLVLNRRIAGRNKT